MCGTLDTLEEVIEAEGKEFQSNPCLIRITDGILVPDTPYVPYNYISGDISA